MFVVCMHAVYVCAHVYNSGDLRLLSVTFLNHSATLLFESESQLSLEPTDTACLAGQLALGNPCLHSQRMELHRTQHLHGFLGFER